jgi:hypothetical protein
MSNYSPVILPIIRNVDPRATAYAICGVQNMSGPVGAVFSMSVGMKTEDLLKLLAEKRTKQHNRLKERIPGLIIGSIIIPMIPILVALICR